MKLPIAAAVFVAAFFLPAHAQQVIPSTPDISIGATSTLDVGIPGRRANWIALKNDCADEVYFDLRGARDRDAQKFPLRLDTGESFSGSFNLAGSIEASASSGASGACTFTVVFGSR